MRSTTLSTVALASLMGVATAHFPRPAHPGPDDSQWPPSDGHGPRPHIHKRARQFGDTKHGSRHLVHARSDPHRVDQMDDSAPTKYSSVVIFGASYCDNAHPRDSKYNASIKQPPYWEGRDSDGPVFAEYLVQGPLGANQTLFDYAFGGAQIDNKLSYGADPDAGEQVQMYIDDISNGNIDRGEGSVLHVWWFGITTLRQIWTDSLEQGAPTKNASAHNRAVQRVQQQIHALVGEVQNAHSNDDINKLPNNNLVLPLPPMEIVPNIIFEAQGRAKNDAALTKTYLTYMAELSSLFNNGVAAGIAKFNTSNNPSNWVRTFDIDSYWRDVSANPAKYGLTNVTVACLDPKTNKPCPDNVRRGYFYWDTLHPSTAGHASIAKAIAPAALSQTYTAAPSAGNATAK